MRYFFAASRLPMAGLLAQNDTVCGKSKSPVSDRAF